MVKMTSTNISTGLAFSGGGIRSAAFCSGVLRRLLEDDLEVDFLSCVSGGGYTGTAYLDWKYREERRQRKENEAPRDWQKEFFEHMTNRTGYVCNWKKPFQGILDTIILSCLVIAVTFLQPFIIWGSYACPVAYLIDLLFGKYLRDEVDCDAVAKASAVSSGKTDAKVSDAKLRDCQERQGTTGDYTVALFAVLSFLFITFYVLRRIRLSPLPSLFFRLSQYTFGALLALTVLPFSFHEFRYAPLWVKILFVPVCVIVWVVLPVLRSKVSYIAIIFSYAFVTYLKVYTGPADLDDVFPDELLNRLLFASGFVLWVVPMVASIDDRLVHIYNRWRLKRAFYHQEGVGATGCSVIDLQDVCPLWTCLITSTQKLGEEEASPLTLADLKGMKPEYLANIVVNRWKNNKDSKNSYELLTMSPTEIERLDRDPNKEQFNGRLEPEDVKLSDAMATSAAALSTHMGKYDNLIEGLTRLHTILGLEMGATMISDLESVKKESFIMRILLPYLVYILRGLPLILPPALHRGVEPPVQAGVITFFAIHLVLAFIALSDTGAKQPSWWEKVARWFIVHVSFVYFVREIFSKVNVGPTPPPILLLSDGGHVENLAILPLLKRRLRKIVVVDGGYKQDDQSYGDSLLNALTLARTKLNCSFQSEDGQDVAFDLMTKFVRPGDGIKPHHYKFKVRYQNDEYGEEGEGEILLIAPRDSQDDETSELTFCCCECCHRQACGCYEWLSKTCCNVFPQHNTANQFFTSRMFTAYHDEGRRACVEANAVDFLKDDEREREHEMTCYVSPV